jgi:RNA polymerase sigma factor (sigma-70 family)
MLQQIISRELVWLYPWLRKMAGALVALERKSPTLQPTALANEVLARLLAWRGELSGDTEASLRILATTVAKQALIDRGRRRMHRQRHLDRMRYKQQSSSQTSEPGAMHSRVATVLIAIEQLETVDADLAGLVRLRFFEGLTHEQATRKLGLSPRTAARRWAFAKAFLADAVRREEENA